MSSTQDQSLDLGTQNQFIHQVSQQQQKEETYILESIQHIEHPLSFWPRLPDGKVILIMNI